MYFKNKILEAIQQMGFVGIIVYGRQGIGKSVYAMKTAYTVLKNWQKVLDATLFDIKDVIEFLKIKKRRPILIWDDAGVHASKYSYFRNWHFVDYLSALIDVIRTRLACLIITTPAPSRLLKVFREIDFYRVKIVKGYNDLIRQAKIYGFYVTPNGFSYTKKLAYEYFNIMLPDDIYSKYVEKREKYVDEVLPKLEKELQ